MKKMFESKRVLLVGLGILGGGTSMAKFIIDQGGELVVTDLRNLELLKTEISIVEKYALKKSKKVKFVLEKHEEELFKNTDIVVFNPAIPYFSKWPQYCLENKIPFYNDFTLFQEYLFFKKNKSKQIWITGTRGKTTTTTFIHHFIKDEAIIGGNVLGSGLQKISNKNPKYFVLETSNYQLEYPITNTNIIQPEIAVITNILIDHINRHKTLEEYRRVKKLIYSYNENVILMLDKKELSIEEIWKNNAVKNIQFTKKVDNKYLGKLHLANNQITALSFAISIAKLLGKKEKEIIKSIKSLPLPKMRQEIIFENKKFKIINDSTATSPDALISSIKSFPNAYFISGGTDAELDFEKLLELIKEKKIIEKKRIIFLEGSATDKIFNLLGKTENKYQNFEDCFKDILSFIKAKKIKKQTTIILSPGAKSFGLFKNEYDRGENFNKIVKKVFK